MILPRIGLERKYRWKQTYIVQIVILFLSFLASAHALGLLISTSISTMTIKSVFGWFGTCSIREKWFGGHRIWSSLQNDPFQNWHFFCTRLTLTTCSSFNYLTMVDYDHVIAFGQEIQRICHQNPSRPK